MPMRLDKIVESFLLGGYLFDNAGKDISMQSRGSEVQLLDYIDSL